MAATTAAIHAPATPPAMTATIQTSLRYQLQFNAELDTDNNGVRDDVDAYIAKQGYTAPQLKAAQQSAKAQADIFLVDISNQGTLRSSDLSLQKSIKCLYLRFSDPIQAHTVGKNIEKITVNTKVRVEAYIKYQIAMNGKVLASPQGDTCE